MNFGSYLRQLREEKGISLKDLAKKLKINQAYLSRVETNKVPPSDTLILKVAKKLDCDPDELMLLARKLPQTWLRSIIKDPSKMTNRLRNVLTNTPSTILFTAESSPVYEKESQIKTAKAIEFSFPFEEISDIAEMESWRKEIYRPIYHIHKWWAQRLGSVFRAIIIGACADNNENIGDHFYKPARFPDIVAYDPFMGSGTTIGEAHKLGCKVIGRDINPVSYFVVRSALAEYSRQEIIDTYRAIQNDLADLIKSYYKASTDNGMADVLYYFWVKTLPCPKCGRSVDLFNSRIFVKHAYKQHHPEGKALCPYCDAINSIHVDADHVTCHKCGKEYNPQAGQANGIKATCLSCHHIFPIAKRVQELGCPPAHRMYAKLILKPSGDKEYMKVDDFDLKLYEKASNELRKRCKAYPVVSIQPGYNTNQVLNYNYTHWHQMFNDRQLLCLSILTERIQKIEKENLRYLFTCLFSGCLEFNNMFCSFKGEGTGAVRHMFAHHILKPERTPLEANLWGTPKSSGSFSTLFEGRILRALDYCSDPFELKVIHRDGRHSGEKVFGLNQKIGGEIAGNYKEFHKKGMDVYLSCGSSAYTDLGNHSVDLVITDPPFFDNVHYSQLADFFYVWLRHILGSKAPFKGTSSRSQEEVQQTDAKEFTQKLTAVYKDCCRVLKDDGLLIFTYHHSRSEGWLSVLQAIHQAGFYIVAAHPVKSEMSVAVPKLQAKEPIDLDIILVCRKLKLVKTYNYVPRGLLADSTERARSLVTRFNKAGRRLSRNDVRIILMSQIIIFLSPLNEFSEMEKFLIFNEVTLKSIIEEIWTAQSISTRKVRELQESLF
ncbi:MAG: helix-turn-helix domain-containing protein [Nitrospirota bacterium]